jgi:cell wall-associated protease
LNIGATNKKDNEQLVSYFSNYGQKTVDVFAPGSGISTTVLNNNYAKSSGTSIAAPVVSGVAAVLKSYYPHLTTKQIREIIIKSAYKPKTKRFFVPSEGKHKKTLKRLSVAGGIVNLYNAVKLADEYQLEK